MADAQGIQVRLMCFVFESLIGDQKLPLKCNKLLLIKEPSFILIEATVKPAYHASPKTKLASAIAQLRELKSSETFVNL